MLRIGILSTARITAWTMIDAVRAVDGVALTGVASRSGERAAAFMRRHGLPAGYPDYRALLRDGAVDAVYIAVPNDGHAAWTRRALEAGKHVLCEKPLSPDPQVVRDLVDLAVRRRLVLMEAMHYRLHPEVRAAVRLLRGGAVGPLSRIGIRFRAPCPGPDDIRLRAECWGGAAMDMGCYALDLLRWIAGEPPEILGAEVPEQRNGVDFTVSVRLAAAGVPAGIFCGFDSGHLDCRADIEGGEARMRMLNPFLPVLPGPEGKPLFRWSVSGRSCPGMRPGTAMQTSYAHQLRVFRDLVARGTVRRGGLVERAETLGRLRRAVGRAMAGTLSP